MRPLPEPVGLRAVREAEEALLGELADHHWRGDLMHITDLVLVVSAVPLSGDATPVSTIAIIAGIGVGILAVTLIVRHRLK